MVQIMDVVICDAGSAGVAAAYYLARQYSITGMLIVDKHAPLSQTSAKSGENFRNWWPSKVMVRLMNRSINLMESLARNSDNFFNMERRGYVYASFKPQRDFQDLIQQYGRLNVGSIRIHNGRDNQNADPYDPLPYSDFAQTLGGAGLLFDQQWSVHAGSFIRIWHHG